MNMNRLVSHCRIAFRPSDLHLNSGLHYRIFLSVTLAWVSAELAAFSTTGYTIDESVILNLHSSPPNACIAKPTDDRSSLIAITPGGDTREEVIVHMAAMASIFLSSGREYMTSKNITAVYTAVFFEGEPINEVGVYAYRFRNKIDAEMFTPVPELNGRIFVLGRHLLVLLWREDVAKTGGCFLALEKYFEGEL